MFFKFYQLNNYKRKKVKSVTGYANNFPIAQFIQHNNKQPRKKI